MSKKGWLRVLMIVCVVLVLIAVTGYYVWNKDHAKVEDTQGIQLSVNELTTAFVQDEQAANAHYLNKAIEVTGSVQQVASNQEGATVLTLAEDGAELAVQCTMRDKGVELAVGETATVKGFCSGSTMFDVILTDCIVK